MTCPCGKRCYCSRKRASADVARTLRKTGRRLRIYDCPICRRFHLTSKAGRVAA